MSPTSNKSLKLRLCEEILSSCLSMESLNSTRIALPLFALFGERLYQAVDIVDKGHVRKLARKDHSSQSLFQVTSCSLCYVLRGDFICSCQEDEESFDPFQSEDFCVHALAVIIGSHTRKFQVSFISKEEYARCLSNFKFRTLLRTFDP